MGGVARKVQSLATTPWAPAWVKTVGTFIRPTSGATVAACWLWVGPMIAETSLSAIALFISLDARSISPAVSYSFISMVTPSPRKS